ncbi:hypothetical protein GSM42_02185 [Shimazuella sp. KC615]|uniref:Uncharacterized protein n=1 Tax=Shimazuella alba TaxID=2690964 RepID=A0A6I4VMB4_9BACL|nr:hypothetical protein [Shimazuella alba]
MIKLEFDLLWWIPNLYLLLYPLFFIPSIIKNVNKTQVIWCNKFVLDLG